ncbi:MAG: hydroxypyruvate isomerase [Verrucomicrobia bacterium]|nr:MAG: hydroxypyruvate isomerase [Verrucomicrobiota bacterium]
MQTRSISRRTALNRLAGASAAAAAAAALDRQLAAAEAAAPALKGRIRHSVCKWCYGDIPLDDFCREVKAIGIRAIDLLGVEDFPTLKKHGMVCSMVSGVPGGIANGLNRIENHDRIVAFFEATAPKVAAAGFRNIICFSGNRRGMSDEEGLENCARGLKRIAAICEKHNVVAVMELLNSKVNHPDYMCDHTAWGVELCKRVGSEHVKLLYDIYHMQIMEGDIIRTIQGDRGRGIEAAAPYIGHYHTGGVPGRHEIDETQELYYPAIMRAILETGYQGYVAQEFVPARKDKFASLRQAVQICDV